MCGGGATGQQELRTLKCTTDSGNGRPRSVRVAGRGGISVGRSRDWRRAPARCWPWGRVEPGGGHECVRRGLRHVGRWRAGGRVRTTRRRAGCSSSRRASRQGRLRLRWSTMRMTSGRRRRRGGWRTRRAGQATDDGATGTIENAELMLRGCWRASGGRERAGG